MAFGTDTVTAPSGCRIGRAASARNGFHPGGNDVDKRRRQQHDGYDNGKRSAQGVCLFHSGMTSAVRANAL